MNEISPQQRYVAYYRVSTQKQGQSGLGLEAQKQTVKQFIKNYGGEIIASFTEVESGKNTHRVEFAKAVDLCELSGSTLLLSAIDRASRNLHELLSIQERVPIRIASMPDISGGIVLNILGAISEHEGKMISQRTRDSLKAAKARGVRLGNPYLDFQRNTDVGPANAVRTESQRQWRKKITKIIDLIVAEEGITSCKEIAELLNTRLGLSTYTGRPFRTATISRLRRLSQRD